MYTAERLTLFLSFDVRAFPQVYQHLQTAMFTAPNSMSRASNWQEMSYNLPSSKL